MKYLVKNGHVIDPANSIDGVFDVIISNGKIEKALKDAGAKLDETIDAEGKIVAPGFVDMHVHLREPGREDKETIRSGTRTALRGGFTSILCMPNTEPPLDNPKIIKAVRDIIDKDGLCNVFIAGAITEGRAGRKLTDFNGLKKAGVIALSDDGSSVEDKSVLLEAFKKSKESSVLIIEHCEDTKLSAGGVINKGFISTKMGLRGVPSESEYGKVKSDLELAKESGSRIHIAHVSCKESVELIRKAKRDGVKVTAETAPHYFTLSDECCVTYDTNTKVNPPLKAKDDV